MKRLSQDEYIIKRHKAEVVEADYFGDKVLYLSDGTYLKLFRRKRLISYSLFFPYSKKFALNALRLKKLGVPTVEVISVYCIPSISRTAVHYRPLEGCVFNSPSLDFTDTLMFKFGEFLRYRSEEHTSELQSRSDLVCRLLLEKKKTKKKKKNSVH